MIREVSWLPRGSVSGMKYFALGFEFEKEAGTLLCIATP
jgi:hypothetical protein